MKQTPEVSTLSLAILGLISQQPLSGYDVRKIFSTTPMWHFSMSPGAIYPALRRLEASGWVKGSVERAMTLRPRQVYSLTKEGEKALRRAIQRPVTRDEIVWHMDNVMLRFGFMGNILGREKTIAYLKELAAEAEAYVASLRKHQADVAGQQAIYGRLALRHGLEGYGATARWARQAIKELQKGSDT